MVQMHSDFTEEQAKKMAKEYDKDGKMALWGMDYFIAEENNVLYDFSCNPALSDAIAYLTNTYLECIESVSFEEWVRCGNHDGKPMVLSKSRFKQIYNEIAQMNDSLQGMCDDIAILYECEWWIFSVEDYTYLATTTYKKYKEINMKEVERAMASFDVLLSLNAVTDIRRQKFIKRINQASNNVLDGYDIDNMTHSQLFEEVDRIFGMGYCGGFHQEWEITDKKSEINQ